MEIYLDLLMLLNFLVDFLLLLGTERLAGFPVRVGRSLAAAALGGIYSGVCLLPGFSFLGNFFWRVLTLGAMGVVAFGLDRSAVKRGGIFVLLNLALGGMALSLGTSNFMALILASGSVWLLCHAAFGGSIGEREYVPLELRYGENKLRVIALRDSGNSLRDPITGEQVLVISGELAEKLTGLTREQIGEPLETIARRSLPGLRLIPYRAVGQRGGMLLAMRFDGVKIGSRVQSAVVAFAPEGLGEGQVYQALAGGAI